MAVPEIFQNIKYYLGLTFEPNVLWLVIPLFISTLIILVYFSKYKEEKPGWNSLVANSLILIFVSMALFRYIYYANEPSAHNFILFPAKTIVASLLLLLGIIILFINFSHFLPEKIAEYTSSPLTINMLAYVSILYVLSGIPNLSAILLSPPVTSPWIIFTSLLIIFILVLIILNIIKRLLVKLFLNLRKLKEKEKLQGIVKDKTIIERKKKELKKEEKNIKKAKSQVSKVEKQVKKKTLKDLEKQKKEAIKLKKAVIKPLKKVKK
tara:strand:- start:1472 stop:2269 length:798 start_codon:yes stop_codon:yes gene_type:complete